MWGTVLGPMVPWFHFTVFLYLFAWPDCLVMCKYRNETKFWKSAVNHWRKKLLRSIVKTLAAAVAKYLFRLKNSFFRLDQYYLQTGLSNILPFQNILSWDLVLLMEVDQGLVCSALFPKMPLQLWKKNIMRPVHLFVTSETGKNPVPFWCKQNIKSHSSNVSFNIDKRFCTKFTFNAVLLFGRF